jgi:hypothetical protein
VEVDREDDGEGDGEGLWRVGVPVGIVSNSSEVRDVEEVVRAG